MLQAGWLDEVKALLARGYDPSLPSLSAIGYAQLIQYLHDELTLEQAIVEIKRKTRILVRRQAAWFKPNDPQIRWLQAGDSKVLENAGQIIEEFLATTKYI
jgi:tRNA dimethylallyltransferase